MHWLNRVTKEQPFLCALIVLMIVMVPGYLRLESTVDTAKDAANSANETADQISVLVEQEQARQAKADLTTCQTRNTATKNGRDRFSTFFTAIEVIFVSGADNDQEKAQATAFVKRLRDAVPLDPALEDVDCNLDSKLDEADYLP